MGITLGQAVVYLLGDDRGLDKTLANSEKNTTSWASNLGSNVNRLVSGALVAGGTAIVGGLAAVGGVAVNTASQVADAQARIQTQLGLTDEQAAAFGDTIKRVYGNNFGESIGDVSQALATTAQELGRVGVTAEEELGRATEHAIALRDAFEVDVGESTNAAAALMDHLGLSSEQAFDFITAGLQDSRISNEDFLDTIREYSNLIGDAGFSAEQFYSILATGSEAGVLGTDKIADAIKEFGIIMNEENDNAKIALEGLGLDYDHMIDQVATGSANWGDYFGDIVSAINAVEDPMIRAQYQTALFGTMAEDLGVSFTEGLSDTAVTMDEISGATESLNAQYNTLGSFWEGMKRRAQVGLEPVGRILLNIANRATPFLEGALERILGVIEDIGAIAGSAFEAFFSVLDEGGSPMEAFLALVQQLLTDLGMGQGEIDNVKETILSLADAISNGFAAAAAFFSEHSEEIKAAVLAIGAVLAGAGIASAVMGIVAAIGTLLSPIGLVVAAVGLLAAAWAGNWGGIRDKATAVIDFIRPYIEQGIAAIRAFWEENGEAILARARLTWTLIKTAIGLAMDQIKERIAFALELIKTIFAAFKAAFQGDWTTFGATLREAWDQIWNRIKERFTNAKTQLVNLARQLVTGIKDKFTNTDWGELGRQIINGIANAITSGAGAIADAAMAAAQAALDAAKAFLGIDSPSKVAAEEIGDPFVEGIAGQIIAGVRKLREAAAFTVKGALTGAASIVTGSGQAATARPAGAILAGAGGGSGNVYNININVPGGARVTAADIASEVKKILDKIARRSDVKTRARSR